MRDGCVFCDYAGPSEVLHEGTVITGNDVAGLSPFQYFVIEPLDPVTPGHRLVIAREHCEDFRNYPRLLGAMMQVAADQACEVGANEIMARGGEASPATACNLIVSSGPAATQTVPHVHVHVVPRRSRDGLLLPWSLEKAGDLDAWLHDIGRHNLARGLRDTRDADGSYEVGVLDKLRRAT